MHGLTNLKIQEGGFNPYEIEFFRIESKVQKQ